MNVDYALDSLELTARLLSILVLVAASATCLVGHAAALWPTKWRHWYRGVFSVILILLSAAIAFFVGAVQVAVLWPPEYGSPETKYFVPMLVYPTVVFLNGIWTLILAHRLRQRLTKLVESGGSPRVTLGSSDGRPVTGLARSSALKKYFVAMLVYRTVAFFSGIWTLILAHRLRQRLTKLVESGGSPRVTLGSSDGRLVMGLARSSALNWWMIFTYLTVGVSFALSLREELRPGDGQFALGSAVFVLLAVNALIGWGYRGVPRARVCAAATRLVLNTSAQPLRGPEVLPRLRTPRAPLPAGIELAHAIDRVRWGERTMAKTDRAAIERATHELAEATRRAAWRNDRAFVRNCALAACALHARNAIEVYPVLTDWLGETWDEDVPRRERAKRFWEALARGAMLAAFVVSIGTLISQINDLSGAV